MEEVIRSFPFIMSVPAQHEHLLPLSEPKTDLAFVAAKERPLKFPLDISPTALHPYMELIRLEKVCSALRELQRS